VIANYLVLSAALFCVGAFGVLARRHLVVVLMSLEVMLNGVNVALLAFARLHGDSGGQVFVLMVMAVAAAEAAVGLAILVAVFRNRGSADARELRDLHG